MVILTVNWILYELKNRIGELKNQEMRAMAMGETELAKRFQIRYEELQQFYIHIENTKQNKQLSVF